MAISAALSEATLLQASIFKNDGIHCDASIVLSQSIDLCLLVLMGDTVEKHISHVAR